MRAPPRSTILVAMALDGIAGAGAHDGAGDDGERDDGEPAGPRTWTATDPDAAGAPTVGTGGSAQG